MADNVITVSGFNSEGQALDTNGNRVVLVKGSTTHTLHSTNEINEPDKLIAVIESIND